MMAAILSLIAAVVAALITRSVMISNHRQGWINGLREDLAALFTAIDVSEQQPSGRSAARLAYRKVLMRLNLNETLHQELARSLEGLLAVQGKAADQDDLDSAVKLARVILKREWDVTKYGLFVAPALYCKALWKEKFPQP